MRFASLSGAARAVVAVAAAGLVAIPVTAGSASAATAAPAAPAADCTWSISRAPVPTGLYWLQVTAAAQQSFVGEGRTENYDATKAILWTDGGAQATVLPSPGHGDATAADISNKGVVLANDLVEGVPYVWSKGKVTSLAKPTGASYVQANAINDAGTVVGLAVIDDQRHGIVWSTAHPKKYQDLGVAKGNLDLTDIDDSGTIVASSSDQFGPRGYGLKGTVSGGLSLITDEADIMDTYANHVNGPIVLGGGAFLEGEDYWNYTAAIWNGDAFTKLPTNSSANGVNASGLVVGADQGNAVIWKNGVGDPLPSLVPDAGANAYAVSDDGLIAGLASTTAEPDSSEQVPVTWTCS